MWRLSSCDLAEIARNSVLQSDFEESVKAAWIGVNYHLPGVLGNDIRKTNLPNIRVQYRHLVLSEELNVLENNAASRLLTAVPSLSPLPQGATLETLAAAARNQPLSPSQRKRIPPQPSRPAGGSPRLAAAAPDAEGALRQRVTSTETYHRSRASSRRLFDGQAAASSEASARIAPRRDSRDTPPPDHGDDAARALEEQLRLWRTTALALAAVALGVCVGAALARRR